MEVLLQPCLALLGALTDVGVAGPLRPVDVGVGLCLRHPGPVAPSGVPGAKRLLVLLLVLVPLGAVGRRGLDHPVRHGLVPQHPLLL